MTSNDLVPVFTGTLQDQSAQLCNARDLHAFLAVGRDFATWIKERIAEYGFSDGEDFVLCSPNPGSKQRGGHNRTDYHLTLDMAKELAMIENNDQGRAVRRYFIAVEKRERANLQNSQAPAALPPPRKITRRSDLSFVGRDASGRLANWIVQNQSPDWHAEFARGQGFFAELAQLAAHNEEQAFDALRFALAGTDWSGSKHWNRRDEPGHGWGAEYGFTDALARAVIDGLRAHRQGTAPDARGKKSAACALRSNSNTRRIAA